MPAISSLRSQRLSDFRSDTEQQYVAFRLRIAWFILPIAAIYRVIPLEKQVPKVTISGNNVIIIDLGKILFGQTKVQDNDLHQLVVNGAEVVSKPSLIIACNQNNQLVGILSNSQPALQKVAETDIVPLPVTYSHRWKTDFIPSMTLPSQERPSLFVINSDHLIANVINTTNRTPNK
jgi:chemotaxis signal transduction protein